jgi:hypothetical protein
LCRNRPLPPWNHHRNASSAMTHTMAWHDNQASPRVRWSRRTTTPIAKMKFQKAARGKKMLAPPVGSLPPPRWARGPLSIPCRPGTPAYMLQNKTKSGACNHAPPRVPQHQNLPPSRGGLRGCHVSSGSGTRLAIKEGSDAVTFIVAPEPLGGLRRATCLVALDPVSLRGGLRAATRPAVPCGL